MVATTGDSGSTSSSKPTSYDIARSLISKLGGNPSNTALVRAVAIWMRFETGATITGNNPWNIRGTGPCGGHYFGNNGPFKTYCSLDQGLSDTARLLSINAYGYPKIKAAVVSGNAKGFLVAVYTSKWCHSTTQTYCYNNGKSLLNAFAGSLSYNWTPSYRSGSPGSIPTSGGSVVPVDYNSSVQDVIDKLKTIGINVDANHRFTHDEAVKIAHDLYHVSGDVGDTIASRWEGKTIAEVIQASKDSLNDPLGIGGLTSAIKPVTDAFAFFLDAENWFYLGMLTAGVVITAWSFRNLFSAQIGRQKPATIITEAVTEPGKKEHSTVTTTRSKSA